LSPLVSGPPRGR